MLIDYVETIRTAYNPQTRASFEISIRSQRRGRDGEHGVRILRIERGVGRARS
jgi:hypothetical protein